MTKKKEKLIKDLHSTIFILIPERKGMSNVRKQKFTFYYIYINTLNIYQFPYS